MDKFDSKTESEESESDSSSSSTKSDELSDSSTILPKRHDKKHRGSSTAGAQDSSSLPPYLPFGVSRKHAPIYAYLVQVCIIANHAVGKDTHIRGIKIFGPPTAQSREKAKRDSKKSRESRRVTGTRAIRQRKEKDVKKRKRAMDGLVRWVQDGADQPSNAEEHDDSDDGNEQSRVGTHIPTSRGLQLLSTLR
jgi:hypothetical protein